MTELRAVRTLLHDEGYTIKGVQRLHKEQGVRRLLTTSQPGGEVVDLSAASVEPAPFEVEDEIGAPEPTLDREALQALREELLEAKFKLDAVLQRID